MKMELRCCCDAHLIGWVHVPNPWATQVTFLLEETADPGRETLTLEIAELMSGKQSRAVKSHDVPLETLRRIASFEEAQ